MNITLTVPLFRTSEGRYDHDRIAAAFRGESVKHEAERELEEATIRDALNTIYDTYRGTAITMPTLEGMVCRALNAQPANWKTMADRVATFVRANSQETVEKDAAGNKLVTKHPNSLFVIQKGKGGGVLRRSDIPEKPAPVAPAAAGSVAPAVPADEDSDEDEAVALSE